MTDAKAGLPRRLAAQGAVSPAYLLITVSTGALLAPLNSTMLAVALPVIRGDLAISHGAAGWLVSSYLIAMAVTQPAGGRLGDMLGRARVFRAGLVAFLVFSLAATAAPNFGLLLASRTLQAVAGAILIPNAMGMLRGSVPGATFGKYSGWNSAIIGATAAAGPLIGGAVLATTAWRYLFLLNVPVVAVALLLATRLRDERDAPRLGGAALDWLGITLFGALLCLVTVTLSTAGAAGARQQALLAVGLVATAAAFAFRQAHTAAPTAEWGLFRKPTFLGASLHILLMNLAMYTTLLATPFFLTEVQHRGSTVAGVLLGGLAAFQALTAPVAGRLGDAVGRRGPAIGSSLVALTAALMLVFSIGPGLSPVFLGVALGMLGIGVGVGFVSASVAAIEAAPKALAGSAAGTQSMMRYFGSIIGVGLLSGLLTTESGDAPDIAVFRLLYILVAVLLGFSVAAAALIRAPSRRPP
ncbi:MAG: hypothetical protein C0506_15330 [Anaerolinea sp.]|nr:hypothetical protein [Anaerolinea sp.]